MQMLEGKEKEPQLWRGRGCELEENTSSCELESTDNSPRHELSKEEARFS